MLTAHQGGNHHVRNSIITHLVSILIRSIHKSLQDIIILRVGGSSSLFDNVLEGLGHDCVGAVSCKVDGERKPSKKYIYRSKAIVQIMVQFSNFIWG